MFLYLYDIFHILQSFGLTLDPGNIMQHNLMKTMKNLSEDSPRSGQDLNQAPTK
jgi:hypothetical protein